MLVLVVVLVVVVVGVQTEETAGAGRRPEYCRPAMAGRQRHWALGYQNTAGAARQQLSKEEIQICNDKREMKSLMEEGEFI